VQARKQVASSIPASSIKGHSPATAFGEGNNPFCGDRSTIYLDVSEGAVRDASVEAVGCAILLASASLMTLAVTVTGKTPDEALTLRERFCAVLTAEASFDVDDLAALAGVRDFPSRIKCAILPWHALGEALKRQVDLRNKRDRAVLPGASDPP
jgi:nitrogen fixation NifU-like protein